MSSCPRSPATSTTGTSQGRLARRVYPVPLAWAPVLPVMRTEGRGEGWESLLIPALLGSPGARAPAPQSVPPATPRRSWGANLGSTHLLQRLWVQSKSGTPPTQARTGLLGSQSWRAHLRQVTWWNQADSTGRLVWCPRRALFTLLCSSGVLVLRSYRDPRTPSLQQLDHVPSLPTPPHGQWGSQRPHWVPRPEDVRDLSRRHGGAPGRCRVSCFRT